MAADFHLAVAASQKTGAAIGQVGAQVTRAVAAVAWVAGERVGDELGLGQCRVAPVALGQVRAADQDFARFPFADQLVGRVDHQQLCIGDALAQRDTRIVGVRIKRMEGHCLGVSVVP